MEFLALGPLEVVDDDGTQVGLGGARRQVVLASLLIRAGEAVSLDRIASNVWGDEIPANPKSAIQVAVSRLRNSLGQDRIHTRGSGYVLRVGPDELDTRVFEDLITEARRAADRNQPESALELHDRALSLWRGPAYDQFAYLDFTQGEIQRLNEHRAAATEARLQLLLGLGRQGEALPEIEALLAADPLREGVWRLYMLALYRAGRQAEALRAYQRATKTLGEELGIEPSRSLRKLEEQILLQAEELELEESESAPSLPEGEVTFLVADAGAAAAEGGDASAAFDIFSSLVRSAGGDVFRSSADQWLAVFTEPSTAVETATAVQAAMAGPILSIGVHQTAARLRGSDYVGLGVSRAIRLAVSAAAGQILLTRRTVDAAEPSLGADFELRQLPPRVLPGLTTPEEIAELIHPDLRQVGPVVDALTNLPSGQLSSFVGRSLELREIGKLLETDRLVTLTGPGGVGKTRLSLQAASDQVGSHPDGVWLVELAPLDSRDMILTTLAEVVGASIDGPNAMRALLERLADLSCLIMLDNCEHVVDDIAELLAKLLPACDGVRILATSRERIGIRGERLFPVPPLAVPVAAQGLRAEELLEYEAVHLFSTRAADLVADFELDATNAAAVVRICRRVDGIPLAIELAAGHVGVLQPHEIAARLDEGFQLLDSSRRRGRRETLEATIDWSYGLLDESEQQVLLASSIFEGGFDMAAAEFVCRVSDAPRPTIDVIARLVGKSLLAARPEAPFTRYEMLETVRAYGRAHLDDDLLEALGERHARYFAKVAALEAGRLETSEMADALGHLRPNAENLRGALTWFVHHDPPAGIEMARHVSFFIKVGLAAEGARLVGSLFEAFRGEETLDLASAKKVAGNLAYSIGDLDQALSWWEESAVIAQRLGDHVGYARTLNNVAILMITAQDRVAEGAELLRQAMEALPADIEPWLRVSFIGNLAAAEFKLGNLEAALADTDEHRALAQRNDLPADEVRALANLGLTLWCLGRLEEAEARLRESIAMAREMGDDEVLSEPLKVLAEVCLATGRISEAQGVAREALELRTAAFQADLPDFIETIGAVAIARGEVAQGVSLVSWARTAKGRSGEAPETPEEKARQPIIDSAHETERRAFEREWREGANLSEAKALALARAVSRATAPDTG